MNQHSKITTGWVGGFAESNPGFAYPNPNLSSLPILGNMDNIDLLDRQQDARWPEFSWETVPGDSQSRCFQMFAPNISRIGYTNEGRVYSIICPQQGTSSPSLGSINIEVTVTGQRGWVNENKKDLAADLGVEGQIWLGPSAHQKPLVKLLWNVFKNSKRPFPSSKANSINVRTHNPENLKQHNFPLQRGESKLFKSPEFARHVKEAWAVQSLGVGIGSVIKTGDDVVDEFNKMIMDVVNLSSGNMLKSGNTLSWNIWSTAPGPVDRTEWRNHAKKWRESIDVDHRAPDNEPDSQGTDPKYFDGTLFTPVDAVLEQEHDLIHEYLKKHFSAKEIIGDFKNIFDDIKKHL
ncbi:MAG: hypothetical protein JKY18_02085 [Flavobacteriales bacterium]|nr:hypothetical protein [Flavobacteriales bacterium]